MGRNSAIVRATVSKKGTTGHWHHVTALPCGNEFGLSFFSVQRRNKKNSAPKIGRNVYVMGGYFLKWLTFVFCKWHVVTVGTLGFIPEDMQSVCLTQLQ